MSDEAPQKAIEVLKSGYVGQGPVVDKFEDELQKVLNSPTRPISLNSCTSALTLALKLLGVGPGDEVITTPITCTATNSPIVTCGARPVWADVDHYTGNINPEDVGRKITSRTKAIIAVDWSGRTCDYNWLKSFKLPVIQDAAHGPIINWDNCGDLICLSFQAIKHLTCVDGGALIVTRPSYHIESPDLGPSWTERARLLRWYGLDRASSTDFRCSQNITEIGYKFHMNDLNAAIGLANLSHLQQIINAHRVNAREYEAVLRPLTQGPQVKRSVQLPRPDDSSCWWTYHIQVEDHKHFTDYMASRGIATSQVHARNDKHTAFNYPSGFLPGVYYFDAHQIAIPVGWWLTSADRDYIIGAIDNYILGGRLA